MMIRGKRGEGLEREGDGGWNGEAVGRRKSLRDGKRGQARLRNYMYCD